MKRLTIACGWLLALGLHAGNTIEPGEFYLEPPTFHSLGFQWNMSGDDNRNATVAVAYRKENSIRARIHQNKNARFLD